MSNQPAKTVNVEFSTEYHALWMHWERGATGRDVQGAYREIGAYLDTVDIATCVIVDLRQNLYMPIKETLTGALFGPYNHPKLGAWLVIGANAFAESVATTLSGITKQEKVHWFQNETAVLAYLEKHCERFLSPLNS